MSSDRRDSKLIAGNDKSREKSTCRQETTLNPQKWWSGDHEAEEDQWKKDFFIAYSDEGSKIQSKNEQKLKSTRKKLAKSDGCEGGNSDIPVPSASTKLPRIPIKFGTVAVVLLIAAVLLAAWAIICKLMTPPKPPEPTLHRFLSAVPKKKDTDSQEKLVDYFKLQGLTGKSSTLKDLLQSAEVKAVLKDKAFLRNTFPNIGRDDTSEEITASLLLVFVAFRTEDGCLPLREALCKLDHNLQVPLQQFLLNLERFKDDLVRMRLDDLQRACENVTWQCSPERQFVSPPGLSVLSPEVGLSPLQTYFQTPHRTPQRKGAKRAAAKCRLCSGGERLKQLQSQLEEEDNEKVSLLKSQQQSKAVIADLELKLNTERTRNVNLTHSVAALEADVSARLKENADLERCCEEARRQVKVLADDVVYAKKCLADVTRERDALEKTSSAANLELKDLRKNFSDQAVALEDATMRVEQLSQLANERKSLIGELEEKIEEMRAMNSAADNSALCQSFQPGECLGDQLLMNAQQENAILKKEMDDLRAQMASCIQDLESKAASLQSELEQRQTELKTSQDLTTSLREEIAEREERIQSLTGVIAEKENRVSELKSQASSLQKDLESREQDLQTSEDVSASLREQIAERDGRIKMLTETLFEKEKHIQELRTEILSTQKDLESCQQELKTSRVSCDSLLEEVSERNETVQVLTDRLFGKDNLIDELRYNVSVLEKDLYSSENGCQKLKREIADRDQEITSLKRIIAEKENVVQQLESEASSLQKDIESCQQELKTCMEDNSLKIQQLEHSVKHLENTLAADVALKLAAESKVAELNNVLSECRGEIKDLNSRLEVMKAEKAQIAAELIAQVEALTESFREVSEKLQHEQCLKDENARALARAQEEIAEKSKILAEKDAQLEELNTQLRDLTKDINEKSASLDDLKTEIASLTASVEKEISEKAAIEAKLQNTLKCLRECEEQIKEKDLGIETLRHELVTLSEDRDKSMAECRAEINAMKTVQVSLEVELEDERKLSGSLKAQTLELRQEMADKEQVIQEHLKQLEGSRSREVALGKELSEKVTELTALADEVSASSNSISDLKSVKSLLEKELKSLESELASLQTSLGQSQDCVEKLSMELSAGKDEKTSLKKKIAELEDKTRQITQEKEALREDLENMNENLSSEVEEKTNRICEISRQFEEVRNSLSTEIDKLNAQIQTLNADILRLMAEGQESAKKIEEYEMEADSLRKTTEQDARKAEEAQMLLSSQLESASKQIVEKEAELLRLRTELEESVKKYGLLELRAEELAQRLEEETSAFQRMEEQLSADLEDVKSKLEEKTAEINQLSTKEAESSTKINLMKTELRKKKTAFDELTALLQDSCKMTKELEARVDKCDQNNAKILEKQKQASRGLQDITKALKSKEAELSAMKSKYDEVVETSAQLKGRLATLIESECSLTAELRGAKEKMDQTSAELEISNKKLSDEKKKSTRFKEELASRMASAESSLQSQNAEVIRLTSELEKVTGESEELQKAVKSLENGLEKQSSNHLEVKELLTSEVSSLKTELEEKSSEVERLRSEVEQGQVTIQKLEVSNVDLKKKLEEEESNFSVSKSQMEGQLEEKEAEVVRLSSAVEALQKIVHDSASELVSLQTKFEEQETNFNAEKSQLCSEMDTINAQLQVKETEVAQFVSDLEKLQQNMQTSESECVKLKAKLEEQESNLSAAKSQLCSELATAQEQLLRKEADLAQMKSEVEELSKKLYESEKKYLTTQTKLEEQESNFSVSKSQLCAELDSVEQQLHEKEAEVMQLKSALEEQQQKVQESKEECDGLKVKLQEEEAKFLETQAQLSSERDEATARLEQQAVDFSRMKTKMVADWEQQQRESAITMREYEAKVRALEEVKSVSMAELHKLLRSHGQLKQELGDLVSQSSAKNTKLDMQVKHAESKCQDLTSNLASAMSNVEYFQATVQQLRNQQDKMVRQLSEKDEVIQQLNRECESRKKSANTQINSMKTLLETLKITPAVQIGETSTDPFSAIMSKLQEELEARTLRQNETLEMLNKLRSDLHVLQCEKIKLQNILTKSAVKYWSTVQVGEMLSKLEKADSAKEAVAGGISVEITSGESAGECLLGEVAAVADNMALMKSVLKKLMVWLVELQNVADARQTLLTKAHDDYKALERRTCSLAEVNSKLSTEILHAKNLSSVESKLREGDLTSLKTTVSALNSKIQQLTLTNSELNAQVGQLGDQVKQLSSANSAMCAEKDEMLKELSRLREELGKAASVGKKHLEYENTFQNILKTSEDIAVSLQRLRSEVPEMLTVIGGLERHRSGLSDQLLTAIRSIFRGDDTDTQTSEKLQDIQTRLNNILENVSLIEAKNGPEELSDSLEEIAIPDRTFPIINLHEDTFCMPPVVEDRPRSKKPPSPVISARGAPAWQLSPPSSKKPAPKKQVPIKQDRQTNGESWVVPLGPAPAKPARKTDSRSRNDSTSSNSSSKSLPVHSTSQNGRPQQHEVTDFDVVVRKLKREKEVVAKECQAWKSKASEMENLRAKERKEFEDAKSSTREKYEKQLDTIKSEMKKLYNQETAKQKAEQTRLSNALKVKNEELSRENATLKEAMDDMRNQLWTLGDKYLQQQTRNTDSNSSELSRKLDKITLMPSDVWSSNGVKEETDSKGQTSMFPPMPVEDEEEVFDNRYLDDLKSGQREPPTGKARLTELQIRNSMVPPHLKSSYPGETQFVSPGTFPDDAIRAFTLPLSESHSMTDSSGDPSMTRSLIPADKSKKKEQTSYKRPGPPTPSKNGRPSLPGDLRMLTPRAALREQNVPEKTRGTPSRLKSLFRRRESWGVQDENAAPVTPRGKRLGIFPRKPFGGRDF